MILFLIWSKLKEENKTDENLILVDEQNLVFKKIQFRRLESSVKSARMSSL